MATKSNNLTGNVWHSSEDGRFISGPDDEKISVDDLTFANFGLNNAIDLDKLSKVIPLDEEELTLSDFETEDSELTLSDFDSEEEIDDEEENYNSALEMTSEEFKLINEQGRKIPAFDNFSDVVKNLDLFFPDDLVNSHLKNANINTRYSGDKVFIKNTDLSMGFAFDFFTRVRSAKVHFKGITNEEYEEKLATMPQDISAIQNLHDVSSSYLSQSERQELFDVYLKNGKTAYLPVWHGLSGVQAHRDMKTVFAQFKENVEGAADTVLIGDGCFDYACYCAFAKGYSYSSYTTGHDGVLCRLLAPVDEHTKICMDDINAPYDYDIENAPSNWKLKSEIIKEYNMYLPQIKQLVQKKLSNMGVSNKVIQIFLNSLSTSYNHNNRSVPLALLGFDYVYGESQLDIINPARVMMNIDKYKEDD